MAEIAIPIMALGGFYVIANHKKKENFEGNCQKTPRVTKPLLNTNDKFFDKNVTKKIMDENPKEKVNSRQEMSLTGLPIDTSDFKHNNMVPFYSGKSNGATVSADIAEAKLDQMQGVGSQVFNKREQAPLFKPEKDMHLANGAPNVNDFMQTRINPSMRMANTKPWNEEKVAPGLNKGFNSEGGIGFNTGMESRELWGPKTVDQLRIATNPKHTYSLSGHQGPANASIKEMGNIKTQGKVEYHAPDTFYNSGPERWFTTTGVEKASTARGIQMLAHTNRPETTEEYYGTGGNNIQATYTKGQIQPSRRPELKSNNVPTAFAPGKNSATTNDYSRNGHNYLPNNRSTTKQQKEYGAVQGAMRAIVAPIMDVVRPCRKENVIGNLRPHGNATTTVSNTPLYNPNEKAKTTIREMTEDAIGDNYQVITSGQQGDGYTVTKHQPICLQRDTTNNKYLGNAAPFGHNANQTYDAAYKQRLNQNKTHVEYQGSAAPTTINANQTYDAAYKQRLNQNKTHVEYQGSAGPNSMNANQTYNAAYNQRLNYNKTHIDYQGNAAPVSQSAGQTYDAAYNQRNNENKTHTKYTGTAGPNGATAMTTYDSAYQQRNNNMKTQVNRPNQGGTQIFNQTENISIHRRESDVFNKRENVPDVNGRSIPSKELYGRMYTPFEQEEKDRITPDLLSAFKNNPYTQSLHSS